MPYFPPSYLNFYVNLYKYEPASSLQKKLSDSYKTLLQFWATSIPRLFGMFHLILQYSRFNQVGRVIVYRVIHACQCRTTGCFTFILRIRSSCQYIYTSQSAVENCKFTFFVLFLTHLLCQ